MGGELLLCKGLFSLAARTEIFTRTGEGSAAEKRVCMPAGEGGGVACSPTPERITALGDILAHHTEAEQLSEDA